MIFTIPTNASVNFPTGAVLGVRQIGATGPNTGPGNLTVSPVNGTVQILYTTSLTTAHPNSTLWVHQRGTLNNWILGGDVQ
jgi:hypothetical protein